MPDVQKAALPSDVLGKAMNGIAKRLLKLNGMKDTLDGASANDLVKKSGPHNTLVLSWVIPSIEHQLKFLIMAYLAKGFASNWMMSILGLTPPWIPVAPNNVKWQLVDLLKSS